MGIEHMRKANTIHGHAGRTTRTPTYRSWHMMKQRCLNPNFTSFKDYGAKGVTVCDAWLTFAGFLDDMGDRPTSAHVLSRIDHDGSYEPGNVEWALRVDNGRESAERRWTNG